jgi:uncharacterized protein
MSAYPVFAHINNLIRGKKMKSGWLLLMWLAVGIACRSATSLEAIPTGLPISTTAAASLGNQTGFTPVPIVIQPAATRVVFTPALELIPLATLTAQPATLDLTVVFEEEPSLPPTVEQPSSAILDPYKNLSIQYLLERSYGGGELEIQGVMGQEDGFTRYLFSYPSDDLEIYGFANIPTRGNGPFPVVIALHGYVDPAIYKTLAYTSPYADTLAQAGFVVLHPNLRNYPPSSRGENLFRVGMAIDVLNLIQILKEHAGQPGPFEDALPDAIGLWGHSMGGGISLRVAVVSPDVRAAVLYGAMSGDERQNFEAIYEWSDHQRGLEELAVPVEELKGIAPMYFLNWIQAPVSIHHGESDQMVPLQWSLDLCHRLIELGMEPECFTYPGQRHTFNQTGNQVFMERVIDFYKLHLEK